MTDQRHASVPDHDPRDRRRRGCRPRQRGPRPGAAASGRASRRRSRPPWSAPRATPARCWPSCSCATRASRSTQVSSEQLAGAPVAEHLPRLRTDLVVLSRRPRSAASMWPSSARRTAQAAHVVKRLLDDGARVIDLSADFRLDADTYAAWYGPHPYPELLPGAVYGLTELHRAAIAGGDARRQPRLLPDGGAARPGAARAAGPARRRDRRQVGRQRRRQDAQRAHPLLQRRRRPRRLRPRRAPALPRDRRRSGRAPLRPAAPGAPAAARHAAARSRRPSCLTSCRSHRGIVETIYVRAERLPSAGRPARPLRRGLRRRAVREVSDAPPELKDVVGTNDCRIFATSTSAPAPRSWSRPSTTS